ncbi:ubiquitinyl hydrolase [Aspergillus terreus]|uniref:Ubiquitin carboxyl-terminal hydrolase n=1 Tax=Aspergillus terreus TaxID=33178 RepID=A0A5M3Z5V9_ASPTE|nr:hypothetical protein ATETN484_0007069600 [Aspergillus terreus]GFF16662.1 ubiquitinyl hydrolase [Aspergillus terreus]
MASCIHAASQDLRPPSHSQAVYREDCTQCFDCIDDQGGLNVCLTCFNGGCTGDRNHASLHFKRFGHPLVLNIKRSRKKVQRDEPPQKISKLAIVAETEDDIYDTATRVSCYACADDNVDTSIGNLSSVVEGVMKAMTYSKREEVKAWEQEFVPCEHTLCLEQHEHKQTESRGKSLRFPQIAVEHSSNNEDKDLSQCSMCDLKENLWLCLECGNLGCGRSQFGGMGGNSHALAHADMSSHGVAVKLGSITADGTADIYCYKCNEERVDPELAAHLAHWGINLAGREKTEKSLMEMQVEHNLKWDFSMKTEDGHELIPIFGPGFTGLTNLGNSCYLSSVVQCIFDLPEFQQRYYHINGEPPYSQIPAEDFETQMQKLADGLLSGRYSRTDSDIAPSAHSSEPPHQKGIAPSMFKHLVGRGHEEFSTMRQQDAFEFLTHVFKLINRSKHPEILPNPVDSFNFIMEQRLQCLHFPAHRLPVGDDPNAPVQFRPVTLHDCMSASTAEEIVELSCPACGSKDGFSKRSSFKTLPQELVVNARRFELINWVPTKLDIPVEVSDEPLDFTPYLSSGLQEGEELLPETENDESVNTFVPHQPSMDQLLSMGFPAVRAEKALYMTGNNDAEGAMNWLFAHMDDADIDEPINLKQNAGLKVEQDSAKVAMLGEMGIDVTRAQIALAATDGDVTRAIDWVFSHPDITEAADNQQPAADSAGGPKSEGFDSRPARYQLRSIVCHKGASVHAGHYVAFVRKAIPGQEGLSWVMFNDEKVGLLLIEV